LRFQTAETDKMQSMTKKGHQKFYGGNWEMFS